MVRQLTPAVSSMAFLLKAKGAIACGGRAVVSASADQLGVYHCNLYSNLFMGLYLHWVFECMADRVPKQARSLHGSLLQIKW